MEGANNMNQEEQAYTTTSKNKLWKGILIGALAGAAISMLDRQTREATVACAKKGAKAAYNLVENPEIVTDKIKETSDKVRATIESVTEDVSVIANQVEILKEIPPQLASVVKETKDAVAGSVKQEQN